MNYFRQDGSAGYSQMTAQFDYFVMLRTRIETRLAELVPISASTDRLQAAIRHSLLAPAKRVRALLMILTARELGGAGDHALDLACSLEMVHTASLILDDLPAMDDAATRQRLARKSYCLRRSDRHSRRCRSSKPILWSGGGGSKSFIRAAGGRHRGAALGHRLGRPCARARG